MLQEDGSIKTASVSVAPALSLYRKKLKIIAVILLICGLIGTSAYVVLGTVLGGENDDAPKWVNAFLIFAVPLALGLIGYITIVRLGKRERNENRTSECTFYADCFLYHTKAAFQSEMHDKFSYSEAVLKHENEKYGYIFVVSKGILLVFGKEGLSEIEMNTIRKLYSHTVDGETEKLKNYNNNDKNQ